MIITLDWLKQKNACSDGVKYFNTHWPIGEADIQAILVQLKIKDHANYASWLMRNAKYYGERNEQIQAKLAQIRNIKWLKPQQENRAKVAALVQEHLKRLVRFGCIGEAAVVFTNDEAAAWDAVCRASRDAARDAVRDAAWDATRDAARDAVRDAAWDAVWDAARDAEHTLVADLLDWPSPWEPLLEIWELGYWPVCLQKDGKFLVFKPKIEVK